MTALFDDYQPRSFCAEFVQVRGSSVQLPMIMAVVLGLKPLMDDWVPRSRLDDYLAVCKGYGLHARVEANMILVPPERLVELGVVGAEGLTSTHALGLPVGAPEEGMVHVFLSRNPDLLRHGMWYPVAIRGRVIWPPRADLLKYGRYLGYPDCCIRFFRRRNDWTRYSFLYEIYRNTRPGAYRLLCNPLAKDRTYSYIYHMPCRFDCPATRRLAARLRAEIGRREPDFVRRIDQHLGLPYLVFRERKHYAFRGVLEGRTIRYSEVFYPDGAPEGRPYLERLARGDQVVLGEGAVDILRRGRRVDRIEGRSHGFAPEIPFMVAFR